MGDSSAHEFSSPIRRKRPRYNEVFSSDESSSNNNTPVKRPLRGVQARVFSSNSDDSSSDDSLPVKRPVRGGQSRVFSSNSDESSSDDSLPVKRPVRGAQARLSSESSDDSFSGPISTRRVINDSSNESDSYDSEGPLIPARKALGSRRTFFTDSGDSICSEVEDEVKKEIMNSKDEDSSDSDNVTERCIICFKRLIPPVARPSACNHTFHEICLATWSKTANTCPIDRVKYKHINLINENGDILSQRNVTTPPPQVHNDLEPDNPTFCEVCNQHDREDEMLLCDRCEAGYHMNCLDPPLSSVPTGDWFCPECTSRHARRNEVMDLLDGVAEETYWNFEYRAPIPIRSSRRHIRLYRAASNYASSLLPATDAQPSTSSGVQSSSSQRVSKKVKSQKKRRTQRKRTTKYKVELVTTEDGATVEVKLAIQSRGNRKRKRKAVSKKLNKRIKVSSGSFKGRSGRSCKREDTNNPSSGSNFLAPSLDLFGSRPTLDYFSGCEAEDEEEVSGGVGVLRAASTASAVSRSGLVSRKQIARVLSSSNHRPRIIQQVINSSPASTNILDNILRDQSMWHDPRASIASTSSGDVRVTLPKTAAGSRIRTAARGNGNNDNPGRNGRFAGSDVPYRVSQGCSSGSSSVPVNSSVDRSNTNGSSSIGGVEDGSVAGSVGTLDSHIRPIPTPPLPPLIPPPQPPLKLCEDEDFDLYADIEPAHAVSKLVPPPEPPPLLLALDATVDEGGSSADEGLVIDDRPDAYDPEQPNSPSPPPSIEPEKNSNDELPNIPLPSASGNVKLEDIQLPFPKEDNSDSEVPLTEHYSKASLKIAQRSSSSEDEGNAPDFIDDIIERFRKAPPPNCGNSKPVKSTPHRSSHQKVKFRINKNALDDPLEAKKINDLNESNQSKKINEGIKSNSDTSLDDKIKSDVKCKLESLAIKPSNDEPDMKIDETNNSLPIEKHESEEVIPEEKDNDIKEKEVKSDDDTEEPVKNDDLSLSNDAKESEASPLMNDSKLLTDDNLSPETKKDDENLDSSESLKNISQETNESEELGVTSQATGEKSDNQDISDTDELNTSEQSAEAELSDNIITEKDPSPSTPEESSQENLQNVENESLKSGETSGDEHLSSPEFNAKSGIVENGHKSPPFSESPGKRSLSSGEVESDQPDRFSDSPNSPEYDEPPRSKRLTKKRRRADSIKSKDSNKADDSSDLNEGEKDGLVDITDEEISTYEKNWAMENDNENCNQVGGLEGLETEAISECEDGLCEDSQPTAVSQTKKSLLAAISKEEGEIITENEFIPWKRVTKTKERTYREKERETKEKDKTPDRKKKEKKPKEKRKELERYDVRKLISDKPKKRRTDEFGRDLSSSRSRSLSSRDSRLRSEVRRVRDWSKSRRRSRNRSRSLSRGRKRADSRGRRRRSKGRSVDRSRDRLKNRSRERSRGRSRSRTRRLSGKRRSNKSTDRKKADDKSEERQDKKTRDRSRDKRQKSSSSCSTCSCSSCEREKLAANKITVTVPNKVASKSKKSRDKKKEKSRKSKKESKRRRTDSPVPSKEVFTSGDNILVSVNFKSSSKSTSESKRGGSRRVWEDESRKKKDKENQPVRTVVPILAATQEKEKKRQRRKMASTAKPIAIIDLDPSPFREQVMSPTEVIILTDSDHEGKEQGEINHQTMSTGPKTPPEPPVKFSISTKPQLRNMSNPLLEAEGEETERDDGVDDVITHKGPNTPPEPPETYDPFEPTKSRSPSPRGDIEVGRSNSPRVEISRSPDVGVGVVSSKPVEPPAPQLMETAQQQEPSSYMPMHVDPPDMDFSPGMGGDSPYSPGSSEGDDLFEPPPLTKSKPSRPIVSLPLPPLSSAPIVKHAPLKLTPSPLKRRPATTKLTPKKGLAGRKEIGIKLDEDQLKILDELPNSAVEMQVKDKFLKKLNRQERVVEEVKHVLKPHYNKKHVTKEEYKDILRKAVPKICHSRSGEINPLKIQHLIEAYVKKYRHKRKKTTTLPMGILPLKPKPKQTMWS